MFDTNCTALSRGVGRHFESVGGDNWQNMFLYVIAQIDLNGKPKILRVAVVKNQSSAEVQRIRAWLRFRKFVPDPDMMNYPIPSAPIRSFVALTQRRYQRWMR